MYGANVKEIILDKSSDVPRAVGVKLADGTQYKARSVVSNATRWDTFEGLLAGEKLPEVCGQIRRG